MNGGQIYKKQYTGQITSGIKTRTFQLSIINFIKRQLPIWRDDPDRPLEQSEHKLNSQLSKFLNLEARKYFPMIQFSHEEPQFGNRDVDISVSPEEEIIIEAQTYNKYEPVLVIECKRLPAASPDREIEYVTGTKPNKISGGIQRFKLGLHGAKHDLAAMVGYIQSNTAQHWYLKINSWILELAKKPIGDGCVWFDDSLTAFEGNESKGIHSCHSIHSRTSNKVNKIELYHLWIAMNIEN